MRRHLSRGRMSVYEGTLRAVELARRERLERLPTGYFMSWQTRLQYPKNDIELSKESPSPLKLDAEMGDIFSPWGRGDADALFLVSFKPAFERKCRRNKYKAVYADFLPTLFEMSASERILGEVNSVLARAAALFVSFPCIEVARVVLNRGKMRARVPDGLEVPSVFEVIK